MTNRLIATIEDLEDFGEAVGATLQITRRTTLTPCWLVRIQRKGNRDGSTVYRQAVDDSLAEALELCYEAWLEDVEAQRAGRRSTTVVED